MSKSSDWHPDFTGDFGARVWFPDLVNIDYYFRLKQGSQTRGPRTSEKMKILKEISSFFAYFS